MDTSTTHALFGPISRKYCDWFYWLAVISFIFMSLTIVSGLYGMLMNKMKSEYIFALHVDCSYLCRVLFPKSSALHNVCEINYTNRTEKK